ncbi:MAG: hypothetical protein KGI60_02125 [Patescibacteria group bacterium]|nr:hypothetical protein [Patescibacteria group bacterium]
MAKYIGNELYMMIDKELHEIKRQILKDDGWSYEHDPVLLYKALKAVARGRFALLLGRQTPAFPVWKTIKLGIRYEAPYFYRGPLGRRGFGMSDWAYDIVNSVSTEKKGTRVKLANVSVGDLGLRNGSTLTEIFRRAQELDLKICPAEVGPQLRLQYRNQPRNERLHIGMKPDSHYINTIEAVSSPIIFCLERDKDRLLLDVAYADREGGWRATDRWVFVRR